MLRGFVSSSFAFWGAVLRKVLAFRAMLDCPDLLGTFVWAPTVDARYLGPLVAPCCARIGVSLCQLTLGWYRRRRNAGCVTRPHTAGCVNDCISDSSIPPHVVAPCRRRFQQRICGAHVFMMNLRTAQPRRDLSVGSVVGVSGHKRRQIVRNLSTPFTSQQSPGLPVI